MGQVFGMYDDHYINGARLLDQRSMEGGLKAHPPHAAAMVRPNTGSSDQYAGKVSTLSGCADVEVASSVFSVANRMSPSSRRFS